MLLNEQRPGFTVLDSADKKCSNVWTLHLRTAVYTARVDYY